MNYNEKWNIIDELGEGGQGKVYLVTNKLKETNLQDNIISSLTYLTSAHKLNVRAELFKKFKESFIKLLELENTSNQFALKVLHKIENARDSENALARIKREIDVMKKNLHPNLLKIIEVDPEYKWYMSKYYSKRSLSKHTELFKGNFLKTLKAIRPLVEAIGKLHKNGYVHRDIKPQNVFLEDDNQLILGDFGLVYFEDDQHTRISNTFENVGSRDWMPAWAMGIRVDEITPCFDVFSLGKLIWSMLSGKPILQLWYFDRDQFNIEKQFPNSVSMKFANDLLSKCIVQEESNCLSDANILLEEIDYYINILTINADYIDKSYERICKICGIGKYKITIDEDATKIRNFGLQPAGNQKFKIFICDNCSNVQFFSYKGEPPLVWR